MEPGLINIPNQVVCSPETKTQLIEIMGMVQDNVAETCTTYYDRFRRQTHVTPKSYLSFLEGYKVLYKEKHVNIAEMARRYVTTNGIPTFHINKGRLSIKYNNES